MNWEDREHFDKQLAQVVALCTTILNKENHIMTQLDDLNAKIATVQATITQLGTDLTAAIADLKAKIAAGATDLSGPLATLDAINTSIGALDTQAKAE